MKLNISYSFIGSVVFILFFTLLICGSLLHYRGLVFANTQVTKGIVRKYEKLNHSSVFYEYEVNSRLFSGVGSAEGYKLGDKIDVIFSVSNPHVSDIAEDVPTPKDLFAFGFMAASFVSITSMFMFKLNNWLSVK